MENTNKPQKKSLFGFIWPYIVIIGFIAMFVFFILGNNGTQTIQLTETQVAALLDSDEQLVTDVSIKRESTIVTVYGKYTDTTNDNKVYKFEAVIDSETFYTYTYTTPDGDYTIMEIIENRTHEVEGVTLPYYTASNYHIINAYETNWFLEWLPTILIVGAGLIIGFVLLSKLSASVNSSNNKAMDFNKSRARREDTSNVHFDDVAGCYEEKAELIELVDYLKDPRKYTRLGAKLPKGVLLVGPPGTGKTLLAKATAGEAGVPFFSISGSDFVELYVGVGAGRVRDMFKKAKQCAPCLIFIDEIDAVGRQRGAGMGGGNDEREQTLNQLLVEMDGFGDNSGIIVMAATNRDDVLDPALLRAGRFDRQITVDLPDRKGREAILKVHARGKQIDPSVDFSNIAKRTTGFSGADLANVINEAAILAVRANKDIISTREIDEAIDRRIAGPAKNSRSMTEHERKQVAYHEAGHAIIGLTLPYSDKVEKITIVPRGRTGGHVLMGPEEDRFLMTKNELMARIVGYLGGRSSEEIFFDDVSTGAHNDIEVATRIARAMVVEYGMSDLGPIQYEKQSGSVFLGRDYTNNQKNFSTQIAYEIDTEVRRIIDEAHEEAKRVIRERKEDVILLAETLLVVETINDEEIKYLLEHRTLPSLESKVAEQKEVEAPKKPATRKPRAKKVVSEEEVKPAGETKTGEDNKGDKGEE
ncbi:MAG: ATP-dependent zinc metalloprotease FtsH [Bacilli bacterium]